MGHPFPYACETDFPGGNAVVVAAAGGAACDELRFTAHPRGGTEALWFHFRLRRETGPAAPSLKLILLYAGNLLGFGNPAAVRLVAFADQGEWRRTPEKPLVP